MEIFISVTRLRIASFSYLLPFLWWVFKTARQAERAAGFLGGKLGVDANRTFWTITAWSSEEAMRSYRNSEPHLRAMPKLLDWCDEAAVVHWTQEIEMDSFELPDWQQAHNRMVNEGKLSKVKKPSPAQLTKQIAEPKIGKIVKVLKPHQS